MKEPGYPAAHVPLYRALLGVAGTVYMMWWFAVEAILPGSVNPLPSRLCVVGLIGLACGLSYTQWGRAHVRRLFIASVWLITFHYYYLFFRNGGESNWIIGCYITVIAINLGMLSRRSLVSYSVFVLLLSCATVVFVPALRDSVFLPGLITLLVQAYMGLRSRLGIIRVLGESNERFQLLFNATFEGVMVHEGRKIVAANDALTHMLGFSRPEIIGKDPLELIDPAARDVVAQHMLGNDGNPLATRGLSKSGRLVEVEVRAKNYVYDGRSARLVTIQDITDRKRAEREQISALAMAEAVRIRDEFISIASHELKTPLSSLKLQAQMLERQMDKSGGVAPGDLAEVIGLFNRQTNRLTLLVETMLDVSQISTGRLTLARKSADLASIAEEVAGQLKVQNTQLEKMLSVKAHPGLKVLVDRGRVEQILENLLSNAIKYGGGKPLTLEVVESDGHALVHVCDQGPGISAQFTQRIFDRFERGMSPRNVAGLGLGLYIARQFAEAHGGTLTVESEEGKGSRFTLRLPLE
jgi:PAS domain S-box-containing protein